MSTVDSVDLAGVTIDGVPVSEITVDGSVVWSAGPDILYEENFNSGIPSDWGSGGHTWPDNDPYDSTKWQNNKLGVIGKSPTGRGIAHPEEVNQYINNWRFEYRADVDTGSSNHQNRRTGGFHTGENMDGDKYSTRGPGDYWFGFEDKGDTVNIRAKGTSGDVSTRISTGSAMGNLNDEWDVIVESSKRNNSMRVKFWETGTQEPDDWFVEYNDRHIPGRPAFVNLGEFHNTRVCYYDYYRLLEL